MEEKNNKFVIEQLSELKSNPGFLYLLDIIERDLSFKEEALAKIQSPFDGLRQFRTWQTQKQFLTALREYPELFKQTLEEESNKVDLEAELMKYARSPYGEVDTVV